MSIDNNSGPQRYTEQHTATRRQYVGCLLAFFAGLCSPALSAQNLEATLQQRGLVDVQQLDPSILVELKYSTTDNFVGKDVYGDLTRAYLQPLAARQVVRASALLKQRRPDLRLLIYDAARPRAAQWNLWNALTKYPENERRKYVADPRRGSIHNYGCAIDLTVATQAGKALDMGTPYDFFGPLAYPSQEAKLLKQGKLTRAQIDNRRLLRSVMQQAGFSSIEYEWWHFNALPKKKAMMAFRIVE